MALGTPTVTGIEEFFRRCAPYSSGSPGSRNIYEIPTGGRMVEESQIIADPSVGTWKPQELREAMLTAYGSVDIEIQNKSILELAQRIQSGDYKGELNSFDVEGGNKDEAQIHHLCKVDSMTIDAIAGQKLKATLNWKGIYSADGAANQTQSPSSDKVLMWYEGAFAGVSSAELVRASINISHNVEWVPVIVTGGALTPKRRAKYLVERAQIVTATLSFLQQDGQDLMADALAYIASMTLTFTGTNTVTITLTDLQRGAHERPITPYELIEHTATYVATDFGVS